MAADFTAEAHSGSGMRARTLRVAGVVHKSWVCRRYNRPLLCTEWPHRQSGNTFETILPILAEDRIGSYHWGLVAGRTQTRLAWGRKLYVAVRMGRLVLETYDGKAGLLTTEILARAATPLRPVVLDLALDLPPATGSVAIVLQDTEGRRIGQVARVAVSREVR